MKTTRPTRRIPYLRSLAVLAGLFHLQASTLASQVGMVEAQEKISATAGGFGGALDYQDYFGASVAALGDLDGDGTGELAVGAFRDDDGGSNQGAVWILFLEPDGTVASEQKISEVEGGFGGTLDPDDSFGYSVAALGDLDGDGTSDLAVGAWGDDDGGANQGAVWILFLNPDGTVSFEQKISETAGGFGGALDPSDDFGISVASLGDLDGDGTGDLAVGARNDDDGGSSRGAAWILFLNPNGSVASEQKISDTAGGFGGVLDNLGAFGHSVAALGDLDGDGVGDLAVGAYQADDGGIDQGAVWILFLNSDGTVSLEQKISETAGNFGGALGAYDGFGISIAALGDLDGGGTVDLAVGAWGDDDGGADQGAAWILFLHSDGTVCHEQRISETAGGFGGALDPSDSFGYSVGALGDLDGDGYGDLAVGAIQDDDGGADRGAVWILFLEGAPPAEALTVETEQKISETTGAFGGVLDPADDFGAALTELGDLDGDGTGDLAVGAERDDDGDGDQGAVWILFLSPGGMVASEAKISDTAGGFGGVLDVGDHFGCSLARLGDLDGDGNEDLAVGADGDDDGGSNQGAVWVLFLNPDGTVASETKISDTVGGFSGTIDPDDYFGNSIAAVGDIDGDGTGDLAVGAYKDDDGGNYDRGAVWILFLNPDGTVSDYQKISDTQGSFAGVLDFQDWFGCSVAGLGDLDGDGVGELAVGAWGDDDGGSNHGAVWVLFLNSNGTVASHQKISDTQGGLIGEPDDSGFAQSVGALGDLDADGIRDLAVGAPYDDDWGNDRGAVWLLFLNSDGTVASERKISGAQGGFEGTLDHLDLFGTSVAALGDLDCDGKKDLAVGAELDDDGGADQGAVWILSLGRDTTPPVITCPNNITRECTGPAGAVATFSVTATDDTDPSPSKVCVPPSPSIFPMGTTTVNCTATDDAGNSAMCSFQVTVQDTTDPIVTCPPDITVECTHTAGEVVTFSASASDLCDSTPAITSVPVSGSTFPLGITTVTVTATDDSGNSAACTFDVIVQDTASPLITCPADTTVECTGPAGAVVSFSTSVSDACDPTPSLVCVPPSGSIFPDGTTTVTCTATDDSGNSAVCTFDVTVEDTTPPVLTCPPSVHELDAKSGPPGDFVLFAVTCADACDTSPSVICVPPSGSYFPRGTTMVTCIATDDAGNQSTCTFPVVVMPSIRRGGL